MNQFWRLASDYNETKDSDDDWTGYFYSCFKKELRSKVAGSFPAMPATFHQSPKPLKLGQQLTAVTQ